MIDPDDEQLSEDDLEEVAGGHEGVAPLLGEAL